MLQWNINNKFIYGDCGVWATEMEESYIPRDIHKI